jgi:hypothetical protein
MSIERGRLKGGFGAEGTVDRLGRRIGGSNPSQPPNVFTSTQSPIGGPKNVLKPGTQGSLPIQDKKGTSPAPKAGWGRNKVSG